MTCLSWIQLFETVRRSETGQCAHAWYIQNICNYVHKTRRCLSLKLTLINHDCINKQFATTTVGYWTRCTNTVHYSSFASKSISFVILMLHSRKCVLKVSGHFHMEQNTIFARTNEFSFRSVTIRFYTFSLIFHTKTKNAFFSRVVLPIVNTEKFWVDIGKDNIKFEVIMKRSTKKYITGTGMIWFGFLFPTN